MNGDEVLFVRLAGLPEARRDDAHEADERASLLEALIFAEAGVEVLDGRVKWIAGFHELCELLRRLRRDVHLLRFPHGLCVRLSDFANLGFLRQRLEQAFAQDVVELVGVYLHRRQIHRMALCLVLELLEDAGNLGAGLSIGTDEVGQNDTYVAQFSFNDGLKKICQRSSCDFRQVGIADGNRFRVVEVGRKLVEQDECRLALEKIYPCRPARRLEG